MPTSVIQSNDYGQYGMNMENSSMPNMMYMDIGGGVGTASNWSNSSFALDAMTMGFYVRRNIGVEIGMGMLTSGTYEGSAAMINTFHLAAKGMFPFSEDFSAYGKFGVGVSAGSGTETSTEQMSGMGSMNMSSMNMFMPTNAGPFYGIGAQYNISKHFALYLEDSGIVVISGGNGTGFGNVNQTTLGLEIRM